jgi:hypothetical protein
LFDNLGRDELAAVFKAKCRPRKGCKRLAAVTERQ